MSDLVGHALTTLAKVKQHLGITSSDDDALLTDLINSITAYIENACGGRRFKETTYTNELYDGDDFDNWLYLKQYPITGLTKVEYNNGTTDNPDWKENTEGKDYEKYFERGALYLSTKYEGKRNYRITYKAGYAEIPDDLEILANKLVGKIYDKRKSEGKSSVSLAGASITWANFTKEEDFDVINYYKKILV